MKDEWYIKTIRALLRAATANSAPPDKTQALAYFNALWNSIEKYVGVDPECAHWPDVIRAAICSANSAENAVKGVGVEELAKMLDKKFGASFPGIEYTMGYVGKFLAKEFPNGLKITKE